ncbi:MAG: cytochrome c oxidase accessory protein CcoG, partial [Microvirgula sp.]
MSDPQQQDPDNKPRKVVEIQPISLYESHKKIYARQAWGVFANWRIALVVLTQLVYFGLPWLTWNDRPAVLFDLMNRKFYLFGLTLFPQDFIYLAALLISCAFGLFVWTTIAGRLWCGYACPQTVYTEIMMWIENLVEGDRNKRIKLDKGPLTATKIGKKTVKHALWIAVSLLSGITLVGYFLPIRSVFGDLVSLNVAGWEAFWVFFYAGATYLFAGMLREQVCKYMCPYARFQSVMFDADTLIISYDAERGEPRGARKKGIDAHAAGKGDCVNCGICVQVCPTGIDIRDGLQYECIGCAACIDACDDVMDKMGYPRGLIRYTTESALEKKYPESAILTRLKRPRVVMYAVVLLTVLGVAMTSLVMRQPMRLDIVRDRASLVRETDEGMLENTYNLRLINLSEKP